jgi:uncharacterized protein YjbI with pentapeptide repeats
MSEDLLRQLRELSDPADRQRAIDEACKARDGCVLRDVSAAGIDFSGFNLRRIDMEAVDFREATCANAGFSTLIDCELDGVDASRAHFPRLVRCRARRAKFVEAFMGGRTEHCDFSDSDFSGAQIGAFPPNPARDYGDDCFDRANLCAVDAMGVHLTGSSFCQARLTTARLSRTVFSGCDLRSADFSGSNVVGARLDGANIEGASFAGCIVTPDQAEIICGACPSSTAPDLEIVRISPGPQTAALVEALEALEKYRLDWVMIDKVAGTVEKIMVSTFGHGPRGTAFQAETGESLRIYTMEERSSLRTIFVEMADDYVHWAVDLATVRVKVSLAQASKRIELLVDGMHRELFTVG